MLKSIALLLVSSLAVSNAQSKRSSLPLFLGLRIDNPGPITPATTPSNTSPSSSPPTFTGNPEDVADWCFSLYSTFLQESGTPVLVTSTDTFSFPDVTSATTLGEITETTTITFTTTEVPTPYTPPPQCVCIAPTAVI
jgi:hypothetical protein